MRHDRGMILAGAVMILSAGPAWGQQILANDDCFLFRTTPGSPDDVPWNTMRLVVSRSGGSGGVGGTPLKIPFIEFTLGATTAAAVTCNLFCEQANANVTGNIYAKVMDFDQTTATYLNTIGTDAPDDNPTNGYFRPGNGWTEISPVPPPPQTDPPSGTVNTLGNSTGWKSFDMTAYYNAHPGETITIAITNLLPVMGQEIRWRSMENTTAPGLGAWTPYLNVQLNPPECLWEVSPTPTTTAYVLAALTPQSYPITVKNLQGADLTFTVEEVAADGITLQNHAWLSVSPTGGGPISAGNSETVMFTVNSPNTANTGYLRFVPTCGSGTFGAQPQVRTISVINNLVGGEAVYSLYQGNVDPLSADSCGPGCSFEITSDSGNMSMGSVALDSNAYDQKAWRIQDDHLADTWTHFRTSNSAPNIGEGGTHNGNLGSTLVARLKVPGNTAAGTMLGINLNQAPFSGARVEWGGPGPNLPGLVRETFRGVNGVDNGSTSGGYTIIRIASGFGINGSRTIRIYVNEDRDPLPVPLQVLSFSGPGNGPSGRGYGYGFGMEGTADVTGEVWLDWVAFTTAGMFAPGQEVAVIGRSLIPSRCPDPFADIDEDGDVDLNDFAEFQLCYTGSGGSLAEGCECLDRDGDDDIDVHDFGDPLDPEPNTFVACAGGANVPVDINCDNVP